MGSERGVTEININLAMSLVKPLSANWFIENFDYIGGSSDTIVNDFQAGGILGILKM